jgi:hypothetical protein
MKIFDERLKTQGPVSRPHILTVLIFPEIDAKYLNQFCFVYFCFFLCQNQW